MNPVEGVDYIFDRYAFLGVNGSLAAARADEGTREHLRNNFPQELQNLIDPEKGVNDEAIEKAIIFLKNAEIVDAIKKRNQKITLIATE